MEIPIVAVLTACAGLVGFLIARVGYAARLAGLEPGISHKDPKTELQEYLQARRQPPPAYHIVDQSGPDHDKVFTVDVAAAGRVLGQASGRSRKEAEQQAARRALEALDEGSIDLDDAARR